MVNDLISRQAAIEALYNHYEVGNATQNETIDDCVMLIHGLPSAPQEQTAEWVPSTKYNGFLTCSACEDCYIEAWSDKERKWRYCPQCGKRMR